MKILVVHPPYTAKREIVYLPLGLGFVTAVAEQSGHEVTVLDMHNLRIPFKALERKLAKKDYDVCFMGGFALQVESMAEVTQLVKGVSPECQVVLGGVGVSDIPEIILRYTKADAVSIGEAEGVLPVMLESIEEGYPFEDTPGFVYRRRDQIIKNPKAAVPDRLDDLPYPAYHLFDVEYISRFSYNGRGARSIHLMTSRGCPFKCNFCINSILNNKSLLRQIHGEIEEDRFGSQRFRSVESLVKEIQFLRSCYGINDFHFADEEFITHRRRLEEVCRALEPLGITWSTSGRADWATEDKLARMKRAGCTYVIFGVETGSQRLLDLMDKNAKRTSMSMGLRAARTVGVDFIANFMIGHPGETEETVGETVDFCKEHGLIHLPSYVTLFPNSKMFHDFAKNISDWNSYFKNLARIDYTRDLFLNLTKMSRKKLMALRNWSIAETFSSVVAPSLKGFWHHALTRILLIGLVMADHSPNALRWLIRNFIRNAFDLTRSTIGKRKKVPPDPSSVSQQVPPDDYGQVKREDLPDAYEKSLKELTRSLSSYE